MLSVRDRFRENLSRNHGFLDWRRERKRQFVFWEKTTLNLSRPSPVSTPIHPPLCLRPGALDVPTPDVDPSRWNGITMEADEFRALPRVPGYTHELIDGTARIRPVDSPLILLAIRTDDVPAQTRPSVPTTVRPLAPNDRDALVTLWADIFVERPDYGRVDRDHIRTDAQKQIDALLDNSEGANATCSRVALRDGTVVGGLLASTFGKHPQIDVLFVVPHEQRQGIGRTLLRAFVQAVRAAAYIVSTSHPANRSRTPSTRSPIGSARPSANAPLPSIRSAGPKRTNCWNSTSSHKPLRFERASFTEKAHPYRYLVGGSVRQYVICMPGPVFPHRLFDHLLAPFYERTCSCLPTPAWKLLRAPRAQPVPSVLPTGRPSVWPSLPGPTITSPMGCR